MFWRNVVNGKFSGIRGDKTFWAIALFLILTIAVPLAALPVVNAHTPAWSIPTWCYVNVSPNPVGINQPAIVVFWINSYPPTSEGAYGDRWTFMVEITRPDGTKETRGPITSDPVGSGWIMYTPDQLGNYTFVARFEGRTITGLPLYPGRTLQTITGAAYVNDTYLPSTSDPVYLTVQQQPIQDWQEAPLPTGFWTRPISNLNRDWWQVAGNWLGGAAQAWPTGASGGTTTRFAYGLGPESAHIMWTRQYWDGGIMDARFGAVGYYTGLSYESYWSPPIILNGRLYYNVRTPPRYGWYAVSLYTGETLFFQNTTGPVILGGSTYNATLGAGFVNRPEALRTDTSGAIQVGELSFGQILAYDSPNQHGGLPYLWSTTGPVTNTWMMFDAFTGNYICSIANVSSGGTSVYGKDGSITYYNIVNYGTTAAPKYYLTVWNTTHAIQENIPWLRNWYWCWRPILNYTFDGRKGFSLNVSIPTVQGGILAVREREFVIGGTSGKNNDTYVEQGNLWALSLKPGEEGKLLWNITFTPPKTVPDTVTPAGVGVSGPYVFPEDGVFLFQQRVTRDWWGYSLKTGEKLWGPSQRERQFNYYGMSYTVYQGKLLTWGYGGELRAYNITTGEILWNYVAQGVGHESPYGNYPLSLGCIADGKIYIYSTEHSPTMPLWRGPNLRCIDANTGKEIWKITHWGSGPVIADGYLVDLNLYDNRIYCYGKGPSAITVTVQNDVVAKGSSVLIKGIVTDQSAGAKKLVQEGKLSIVPAIADEYMSAWMEYLYMQQAIPGDAKGVPVKLHAVGSDGSVVDIGTVTSDMSGLFKKLWTPPAEGEYTIIATFEGSKSYWPSYAETAVGVTAAPAPSVSPSVPATPSASVSPSATVSASPSAPPAGPAPGVNAYVVAAVVVAVAVMVGAALMLRKRRS